MCRKNTARIRDNSSMSRFSTRIFRSDGNRFEKKIRSIFTAFSLMADAVRDALDPRKSQE